MYISESHLKRKILNGQTEILNEIISDLMKRYEKAIFAKEEPLANILLEMKTEYSQYRTTLNREKYQIKPGD